MRYAGKIRLLMTNLALLELKDTYKKKERMGVT